MGFDEWELDLCREEETAEEPLGLEEGELYRLAYRAEHPELMDPIFCFFPRRMKKD